MEPNYVPEYMYDRSKGGKKYLFYLINFTQNIQMTPFMG